MKKGIIGNLKYLTIHRWFVFIECCKEGMPLLGLLHDWSKIRPSEYFPYANHDFDAERDETGYYKPTDTGDKAFDYAWLLHQKRNKHHWQWWVLPEDNGGVKVLEMPLKYRKEMLCDWRGAGKAQKNGVETKTWYEANKGKMQLAPLTRKWIEEQIK